ncbi:DNA-processing protein DprA [Parasphingorhabdus cellanae]|uniref:DNA-processing protein DprA n=1 Tax=Parasphingorhabdus cellanae TaxID=2806553 RepID=A0ABX7T3Y3_9SPHN|nr:DNA-processing protein DprA [Parasphingorhabdus cellanae]QTD56289.1 DNA-processing protein DprA [Parasphingorhabdus cellanae]
MNEDFDRLRLIRSANIGPVSYVQLIRRYGSAAKALEMIPQLAARGGGRAPRLSDPAAVEREMNETRKLGADYLFLGDPNYPYLLAELGNPPPALIWRGNLSLLNHSTVAIVGARNASAAACRFARDLANSLTTEDISVVSGLARGIDTAAHQGSINRSTIAVIAGGIDIHYPPENEALQGQIARDGLLLAEQPPGTEPKARHFPYRNRIIAGIALGTVVIEAAPKSGSLITARLAAEAGRHVMAVPGSPLDPRSRGCNGLIRDGATLIQSADDVLELIQHFDERAAGANIPYDLFETQEHPSKLQETANEEIEDAARHSLINLLSMTPVSVDELVRQSGLSAASIQLILLELELAGRLTRHAGARVSLPS